MPAPTPRLPRFAVIMAGGQGTRFWPLSRRRCPKQFLRLAGRKSMLQATAARFVPLVGWENILVVTNAAQSAEVRRQLPKLARHQVIIEPSGRGTLPCALLAAHRIASTAADALMILAPADHSISGAAGFRRTVSAACGVAAREQALVTVGVRPRYAETGYGYIETGEALGDGASWVRRFHEKPQRRIAQRYLARRNFLWNAGIFVWRRSVFLDAVGRLQPRVAAAIAAADSAAALRRTYAGLPSLSIDNHLMEPQGRRRQGGARVAVVPAGFDWSDLGSWAALPDVRGSDAVGNTSVGRTVAVDARRNIVFSPQRLVALVGVDDLIVVDGGDALLICSRQQAQDVRRVTQVLGERRWLKYL